jgi:predicted nucleic acid-binding protein
VLFQRANRERWRLVTTNAVIFETYALLLARSSAGRQNALRFLDMVAEDAYQVVRVRQGDEAAAVALVRAHADKTYSLCDALSFIVMERLGITEAIAFDRHFRAYGRFTIL